MPGLITTISNDGKAPECILWAPKGEHRIKASVNDKASEVLVKVTQEAVAFLQADLDQKLSENVRPICYFDHEAGKASFIPTLFGWDEEKGVIMQGEWTKAGREAVEGKDYSYFSPTFGRNTQTGEIVGLLNGVEVGSLVNDPAFESIERIAASKKDDLANVLDIENAEKEPHNADCQQDITKNKTMTEEEIKSLQERVALLEKENAELKGKSKPIEDELDAAKKEVEKVKCESAEKDETLAKDEIEEAVKAGKIAPKDEDAKEFWLSSFKVDAVRARRQLRQLAPNPALEPSSVNTGTPPAKELTGRDRFKNQLTK